MTADLKGYADLEAENARLRSALERIVERSRALSDSWRPDHSGRTETGRNWHDGYVTACSTHSLMAFEALDPAGWQESEEVSRIADFGTDREWFERTGHCGACGNPAEDCLCPDDEPCGCGPHERRTEPMPCTRCKGTGQVAPVRIASRA